ncbi:uncharacterized protein Tco025E_02675 [Trypanosoma conorhini]|uniref:Uncharacterized protein n=1 Tax=Trypanosoma conorhini TaxID=83891 RepID=A0A3R7NM46_9TRYP|nr:uncharacterized protein Tco025E_02675 [Trypanosoma conorhini]RNF23971.1 hypothetical protein Tco025E_02675 [Trypanosoma conorhini]
MDDRNGYRAPVDPLHLPLKGELNGVACALDDTVLDLGDRGWAEEDGRENGAYAGSSQSSTDAPLQERQRRNRLLLEDILSDSSLATRSREPSVSRCCAPSSEMSREPRGGRNCGSYVVEPRMIKLTAVDALLMRAAQEASEKVSNGTKKQALPRGLPQQLSVPFSRRCAFCQKFDSLCSNCHRKWKEVLLKRRQAVALQSYCKLPEDRRSALLFMTAAYGVGEFAAMQLDFDAEKCLHWRSFFFPLSSSTAEQYYKFVMTGEVYALHVAFSYDRVDVAEVLLGHPRCLLLKSEYRIDPVELLHQPLKPEWETLLHASDVYLNHLLVERAKQLRRAEDWDGAEALYTELLQRKPDSEHAHSGWAKMRYDQGYVTDCIHLCDCMISGTTIVDWNEIHLESIKVLREAAVQRYHEYCHVVESEGVLKACGCVILDRVRVPIKKLPFSILVDSIFVFCDAVTLWNISKCTRMPLVRTVAEKLAILLPTWCLQTLLMSEPGFQELSEQLLGSLPSVVGSLVIAPVRPLGISVLAMAGFNMFLVRVHAAGLSAKTVKTGPSGLSLFGFRRKHPMEGRQASNGAAEVAISKQYRIQRSRVEEPWCVKGTGDWAVDQRSVEVLQTQLLQMQTSFP